MSAVRKVFKGYLIGPDGEKIATTAHKEGYGWIVGGDLACAHTELGYQIYIISNGAIYWLKGSRLIFQDNYNGEA